MSNYIAARRPYGYASTPPSGTLVAMRQLPNSMASLVFIYAMAAVCLLLPYIQYNLAEFRWYAFSGVIFLWMLINVPWFRCLAFGKLFLLLLGTNLILRIASAAWSDDVFYTFQRGLSLCLMFGMLAVLTTRIVAKDRLRLAAVLIAVHSAAILVPGIILHWINYIYVPWTGTPLYLGGRYTGITWNPNQIAVSSIVAFPVVLALWWENKRRVWWLLLLLVVLQSLFLSASRAGMLCLFVGIGTFFSVRYRVRWMLPVIIAALLAVTGLYNGSRMVRNGINRFVFRSANYHQDFSIAEAAKGRFMVWDPVLKTIKESPGVTLWVGKGFGTGGINLRGHGLLQAHNSYLQALQENGIIGVVLLAILIASVLYVVLKFIFYQQPLKHRTLWAGIAGAATAGLANSFFESWLLSVGNLAMLPFWFTVLLIASYYRKWNVPVGQGGLS